MIATHNIKVNGRWIHAGEEYGEKAPKAPKQAIEPVAEPDIPVPEEKVPEEKEQKTETKPRSTTRRKKISE